MITIEDVRVEFQHDTGRLEVLGGVNLVVEAGEFVSLLGPSGCGKSTLLRVIGGLLEATTGAVSIGGRSPEKARIDREFGFVFQDPVLFPWRDVLRNVLLPAEVFGEEGRGNGAEAKATAEAMIELVGLKGFEHALPQQLSGGMQSRVAIARALSYRPSILLMDEPFGDLDELTRTRMNGELLRLWKATDSTVVFVTHSIDEAVFLSDRVAVMSERPSTIAAEVDIHLPRPRELSVREGREFAELAGELRAALDVPA